MALGIVHEGSRRSTPDLDNELYGGPKGGIVRYHLRVSRRDCYLLVRNPSPFHRPSPATSESETTMANASSSVALWGPSSLKPGAFASTAPRIQYPIARKSPSLAWLLKPSDFAAMPSKPASCALRSTSRYAPSACESSSYRLRFSTKYLLDCSSAVFRSDTRMCLGNDSESTFSNARLHRRCSALAALSSARSKALSLFWSSTAARAACLSVFLSSAVDTGPIGTPSSHLARSRHWAAKYLWRRSYILLMNKAHRQLLSDFFLPVRASVSSHLCEIQIRTIYSRPGVQVHLLPPMASVVHTASSSFSAAIHSLSRVVSSNSAVRAVAAVSRNSSNFKKKDAVSAWNGDDTSYSTALSKVTCSLRVAGYLGRVRIAEALHVGFLSDRLRPSLLPGRIFGSLFVGPESIYEIEYLTPKPLRKLQLLKTQRQTKLAVARPGRTIGASTAVKRPSQSRQTVPSDLRKLVISRAMAGKTFVYLLAHCTNDFRFLPELRVSILAGMVRRRNSTKSSASLNKEMHETRVLSECTIRCLSVWQETQFLVYTSSPFGMDSFPSLFSQLIYNLSWLTITSSKIQAGLVEMILSLAQTGHHWVDQTVLNGLKMASQDRRIRISTHFMFKTRVLSRVRQPIRLSASTTALPFMTQHHAQSLLTNELLGRDLA
ncbi:hypothetical protein KC337_g84 [Hortaea werneckii]|nr:hypothetical protein KC337_g84 [Hortaea werneckii]